MRDRTNTEPGPAVANGPTQTSVNGAAAPTPEQRKRWVEMCRGQSQALHVAYRAAKEDASRATTASGEVRWLERAERYLDESAEWAALADYLSRGETPG